MRLLLSALNSMLSISCIEFFNGIKSILNFIITFSARNLHFVRFISKLCKDFNFAIHAQKYLEQACRNSNFGWVCVEQEVFLPL